MNPTLCTDLSYHNPLTLNYRAGTAYPAKSSGAPPKETRRPDVPSAAGHIWFRAMSAAPVLQFIDETLAGEMLRDHEVRLQASETVNARALLQLRFGDNAEVACEAFSRGAFRLQVDGAPIESLDTHIHLVPGLAVRLIRLAPVTEQ